MLRRISKDFCELSSANLNKFDAKKQAANYLRLCVDSFVMNEDKAGRRQKRGGSIHTSRSIFPQRKKSCAQP